MKVFVTGGTGFIGKAIVRQLLEKGHVPRVLTHRSRLPGDWESRGVEIAPGDINEPESLRGKLDGCEAVIHLVGIIAETGKNTFESVHFRGTQAMVDAALAAGISRFVHMSALGARSSASSRYHITKFMGEEAVLNAPVEQTIFRPSIIFGPGSLFCKQMMDLVRFSPFVPVIVSHNGKYQPISVHEVAQAFVESLEEVKTHYQTYELGGPRVYTMREMMEAFVKGMGKKRVLMPVPAEMLYYPTRITDGLPFPFPLTSDQLLMLQEDNTCPLEPIQAAFGIPKQTLEEGIQEILTQKQKS